MPPLVPALLRTDRLLLRCWQPRDASRLLPVLEANVSHLAGWIPAAVASPAPLAEVTARLQRFADEFARDQAWRYGLFSPDESTILGEVDLFPRVAAERVPYREADRLEIGYWLRADVTGQGLATEAARAMLGVAASVAGMRSVEIRCDVRNERSAAIPRRLGFELVALVARADGEEDEPTTDMIWQFRLAVPSEPGTPRP
ncbi:MAG TPA: GNAT family N-acetyltransferase [Gemmatimonadaceae bacterium]